MNAFIDSPRTAAADADQGDHEFSFAAADFEKVRKLIYQRAGISLHEGKRAMVYSRLSRRLRETGHQSFKDYLQWLEAASGPNGEQEWQQFINCLTTNLTAFFREDHHFIAFAEALKAFVGKAPRIWCNAASTGEEPYSIVMVLAEVLGERTAARLMASDIDTKVLATARRGVYSADARGLSPERMRRHFLRGTGTNSGSIRIKPELGQMVDFKPFNLMTPHWSMGEPFDMVFCRNVMIYFDHDTQRKVLERIHGVMKPGSLLFVGHSENFTDARDLFHLRGKTIYQRV
ncbi:CheR family methyltransferase [Ideonella sp.]|uniref:CheR family methyltransferase n=1 Tax=Ideonella sp. TaxID=1929293 RepID=UPI003BB76703